MRRRVSWRFVARLAQRRIARWLAAALVLTLAGIVTLAVAVALVPFNPDDLAAAARSTVVLDRHGQHLRSYLGNDECWRIPVRLDEVSTHVIQATVAVEDRRFYEHRGVDLLAICRSVLLNIRGGRVISGASTLSMQAAMLNQPNDRSIRRKLVQAFRALQLERVRTKREILEFYLTHAPYGGNVYGVEAAARRYFGKSATELSLSEASLLAGIPQSPSRLRPDRHPQASEKRRRIVLDRMLACGFISREDHLRSSSRNVHARAFDAPVRAPHFSDFVVERYGGNQVIRTTLEMGVQSRAEELLRKQLDELRNADISNGSIVVLDNSNGDVLAMVGSGDYSSVPTSGQVNGALALRSPGSALKPFIYARAFEGGALLPSTVLYDVPRYFVGYEPENFDKTFHGFVRADKAMAWSLNIPAIDAIDATGPEVCLGLLRNAGINSLRESAGKYGLSLAIGTCEVRLLELTNAYAMLARGGEYRPWRVVQGRQPIASRRRLLSNDACYFVNRALADPQLRPPEEVDAALYGLSGVAWKTGTSSGFRDAWTIAYDHRYTVGVWMGNFDGHPSKALVGAHTAAPVALKMMRQLRGSAPAGGADWLKKPDRLRNVVACRVTGRMATEHCTTTTTVECVRGSMPEERLRCDVHHPVLVDEVSGERVCTRCMGTRQVCERVFAFWPQNVTAWLAATGIPAEAPPRHPPNCVTRVAIPAPRITSPTPGDAFVLMGGRDSEVQKLALKATCSANASQLFWFLNGEMVQAVAPGQAAFVSVKPGYHTVRCVDDMGRADWVSFSVEAD